MRILVCDNYEAMSKKAAEMILSQITLKPDAVLGLATGSTPIGMYDELIKMYEAGRVDFSQVRTVNLDEYYNLPKSNDQSYDYFMRHHLFEAINIPTDAIEIPNGMADDVAEECQRYERAIEALGGVDIQVLGIGHNAHIGFNEPADHFEAMTHLVNLKASTIEANARFFASEADVPKQALTMGVGTILKAKKIMLLATGEGKAEAIYNVVYGQVTPEVPGSILQFHDDVVLILDKEAASRLHTNDYKCV
jgi:glucosamine-6-phosphate deaminase